MRMDVGEILIRSLGWALLDAIPYDLTCSKHSIEGWAIDNRIPPYAVWWSLTYGIRHLPEPYRSRVLCSKIEDVLKSFGITNHTRYVDLDGPTASILRLYRHLNKLSASFFRYLSQEITTDNIGMAVDKYNKIVTYIKSTAPTGSMWKLVNIREQLRTYVKARLGGDDWHIAPDSLKRKRCRYTVLRERQHRRMRSRICGSVPANQDEDLRLRMQHEHGCALPLTY